MLGDGLTKGSIDRAALRTCMRGAVNATHEARVFNPIRHVNNARSSERRGDDFEEVMVTKVLMVNRIAAESTASSSTQVEVDPGGAHQGEPGDEQGEVPEQQSSYLSRHERRRRNLRERDLVRHKDMKAQERESSSRRTRSWINSGGPLQGGRKSAEPIG